MLPNPNDIGNHKFRNVEAICIPIPPYHDLFGYFLIDPMILNKIEIHEYYKKKYPNNEIVYLTIKNSKIEQ